MKKKQSVVCLGLALLLAVLLPLSPVAGATSEEAYLPLSSPAKNADTRGIQAGTELTVASSTAMSGHFSTDMWGKNTSDLEVRALLHGYETVTSDSQQEEVLNGTVVKSVQMQPGSGGYQQYTIELYDDLYYSDGSSITAEDYVFAILLAGAPEIAEIGGVPLGLNYIDGYTQYALGNTKVISGVRYLDSHTFSLRTDSEYMPYFYGVEMLLTIPLPISVIAPGCRVLDDGEGVYIAAQEGLGSATGEATGYTPGMFSADMLRETMLNPDTGYEFFPQVTSGPYKLEQYDAENSVATFVVNEYYKGNFEGQKPHIERITFLQIDGVDMVDALSSGQVDLLSKVTDPTAIAAGTALANEQGDDFSATFYPRTGLAYLAFACEAGPMSSTAVRKALSLALDIDKFVSKDVSNTFQRIYGYYGLGQWMLEQAGVPEQLEALRWEMDIEEANALLDADGWVYDETGADYIPGEGHIRHRRTEDGLEALRVDWAKAEESRLANQVEQMLTEALPQIGADLSITQVSFEELLRHYYRQEERTYNTFFLASSFEYYFDPSLEFSTLQLMQGTGNKTGIMDEELANLTISMRETAPADYALYIERWLAFQQRFVELMPMIPLYSSTYQDFYASALQNYRVEDFSGWAFAIPYANLAE